MEPKTFEEAIDSVLAEMREVMLKKQYSYGPKNISAFGQVGVLVRLSDKIERMKHLIINNRDPENESLDDSWLDTANYGLIGLMLKRGIWGLPLEDSIPANEQLKLINDQHEFTVYGKVYK